MRRYEIVNRKGCFDLFHPNQTQYLSSVRIYEGNERKYTVSLFDDNHFLLHDDARPEEIAWCISEYLERVFTSSRDEYLEAADYLEEHAVELWRNKLIEKKNRLLKELCKVEAEIEKLTAKEVSHNGD